MVQGERSGLLRQPHPPLPAKNDAAEESPEPVKHAHLGHRSTRDRCS